MEFISILIKILMQEGQVMALLLLALIQRQNMKEQQQLVKTLLPMVGDQLQLVLMPKPLMNLLPQWVINHYLQVGVLLPMVLPQRLFMQALLPSVIGLRALQHMVQRLEHHPMLQGITQLH